MITKERLKELIKQKAKVYSVGMCFIFDYKLDNTYYIEDNNLVQSFCEFDDDVITRYLGTLDELFETKEDAEFALRFKRIPKTEYLDLPTWEEIEDTYNLEFTNSSFEVYKVKNRILVMTNRNYLDLYDYIFDKPATKENYLEACEICRKLFLGEKV